MAWAVEIAVFDYQNHDFLSKCGWQLHTLLALTSALQDLLHQLMEPHLAATCFVQPQADS